MGVQICVFFFVLFCFPKVGKTFWSLGSKI